MLLKFPVNMHGLFLQKLKRQYNIGIINKIVIDKLKTVSVDLSKLSNLVNNNVVNNFV